MNQAVKLTFLFLAVLMENGCQKKNTIPILLHDNAEAQIREDHVTDRSEAETFAEIQMPASDFLDNSTDPILFPYLLNNPTIRVDISANVVIQRIGYKNFAQNDRNYGDFERGTEWYSIYLFRNGEFIGIDNVQIYQGEITRHKQTENNHNSDGTIIVTYYQFGTNQISSQHIFNWNENILVANQGNRGGRPTSVVVKNEREYLYFSSHNRYSLNLPATKIEFISNNETIIYGCDITTGETISTRYYENGILMKVEYRDGRMETYTVSSGTGEIITTDKTGIVTARAKLEREINEDGYLVYELVVREAGDGYEYFFTKDTF